MVSGVVVSDRDRGRVDASLCALPSFALFVKEERCRGPTEACDDMFPETYAMQKIKDVLRLRLVAGVESCRQLGAR